MNRTLLLFAVLLLAACSKTAEISAQNVLTPPIAFVAAVPPSAPATQEKSGPRLVQLRTLHAIAAFDEDRVATNNGLFDPETLAPLPQPPRETKIAHPSLPSIPPAPVSQIVGNHKLVETESEDAVVTNVATGREILRVDACAAGGGWSWSLTNRFLICDSSRGGLAVWDLDAKGPSLDDQVWLGEGVTISPNDEYAVAEPVPSWGNGEPTHRGIVYFDFASRKKKVVLAATFRDSEKGTAARPFSVMIGPRGDLFAATGDSEIAVFSGNDGSKIASLPAMRGGLVSFSASGKYLLQTRGSYSTVYRLDL